MPSLAKTYSQPGDQQWQTIKDSDVTRLSNSISKGEGGDGISCLGLKNVVYFKKNYDNNYAHTRICLPYTGLEPQGDDAPCKKPQSETSYSQPDDSCNPNPFVTDAYYQEGSNKTIACMTPYQFLNNRNYKKEWKAAIIVTPSTPDDISKAVKFARKHGLGISIMSTGHDLQDRNAGAGPNTLLIRTTCFQDWKVSAESIVSDAEGNLWKEGYAEAGAGLTFGSNFWGGPKISKGAYIQAFEAGKEIVGGSCQSVGLVGWTLGGGRGLTSPKYGLGVDQLLHADLVNAEGELISANYTHNSDLFYALRGGGGGFGVIYNIKMKLHTPSCANGNMDKCYTNFNYRWTGVYSGSSTIEYIKKILKSYVDWSIKYRLNWYSGAYLGYDEASGNYTIGIGGVSFGDNSTFPWFLSDFKQDLVSNKPTLIQTSKYFCEIFPDPSNTDNCHFSQYWVGRWTQAIRNEVTAKAIQGDAPDGGLISKMLEYWIPHCLKNPYSPCTSAWVINAANPAIGHSGLGVYDSGGPISQEFRKSSFEVFNRGVMSTKLHLTFQQKEDWMHYTLAPQIYKYTNTSNFNLNEYTQSPGQWERRFWGKENHCKLVEIKKRHDPDQMFACRHCIGDEVGYNDE